MKRFCYACREEQEVIEDDGEKYCASCTSTDLAGAFIRQRLATPSSSPAAPPFDVTAESDEDANALNGTEDGLDEDDSPEEPSALPSAVESHGYRAALIDAGRGHLLP